MSEQIINSYKLSRDWFDFCFENPEKIKAYHTAVYFFAIEHCNRLGWRKKFGFPTTMAMDAIGIKSYKTYKSTLDDLVEWGFIEMVEYSKNQYSSNIIALVSYTKALTKALDKAMRKHDTKQVQSTDQSTHQSNTSINKQENNITSKQLNNKQREKKSVSIFKQNLSAICEDSNLIDEYVLHRKKVKAMDSERAWKMFIKEVSNSQFSINEILEKCLAHGWKGFEADWIKKDEPRKQNNCPSGGLPHIIRDKSLSRRPPRTNK